MLLGCGLALRRSSSGPVFLVVRLRVLPWFISQDTSWRSEGRISIGQGWRVWIDSSVAAMLVCLAEHAEKIMPSVALWLESVFTFDPLHFHAVTHLVLRPRTSRPFPWTPRPQHLSWNPHSKQLSGTTMCTRTSLWVSAVTASSRKQA